MWICICRSEFFQCCSITDGLESTALCQMEFLSIQIHNAPVGTLINTQHQLLKMCTLCSDYLTVFVLQGFINYVCWRRKVHISITSSALSLLKSLPEHAFHWSGAWSTAEQGACSGVESVFLWQSWWGCPGCKLFMLYYSLFPQRTAV